MKLDEAAFGIIQTLRHQALFETPASQPGTIVKDLCLFHCQSVVDKVRSFLSHWRFDGFIWRFLYVALQPLVLLLDDPQGRQLFVNACQMMRTGADRYPICDTLLYALRAFAWAIGREIPADAMPSISTQEVYTHLKSLPIGFSLPKQGDVKDLLRAKAREADKSEENLAALIKAWALH